MLFEPDILVTGRDYPDIGLVVEVKSRLSQLPETEEQLKRYMSGMQCPVGMLVTSETLYLYRDTYTDVGPSSIERVGAFSMAGLLDEARLHAGSSVPANAELRLVAAVQDWLERLASEANLSELPPDLRKAITEHVLPALAKGEVRAAGPRWRHTAS